MTILQRRIRNYGILTVVVAFMLYSILTTGDESKGDKTFSAIAFVGFVGFCILVYQLSQYGRKAKKDLDQVLAALGGQRVASTQSLINARKSQNPSKLVFLRRTQNTTPLFGYEGTYQDQQYWMYDMEFRGSSFMHNQKNYPVLILEFSLPLQTIPMLAVESIELGQLSNVSRVQLESNTFNQRYFVYTQESAFAYQYLDPTLMQYLLDRKVEAVELSDSSLIIAVQLAYLTEETLKDLFTLSNKLKEKLMHNLAL